MNKFTKGVLITIVGVVYLLVSFFLWPLKRPGSPLMSGIGIFILIMIPIFVVVMIVTKGKGLKKSEDSGLHLIQWWRYIRPFPDPIMKVLTVLLVLLGIYILAGFMGWLR